jgi:hypothetical protein
MKLVRDVERSLRWMQPFSETRTGDLLRQFCEHSRKLETLSRGMVRQMIRPDDMGKVSCESVED